MFKRWYRPLVWAVIISMLVPPPTTFAQEPTTQQIKKVYLEGVVVSGAGERWQEAFEATKLSRSAQEAALEATKNLGALTLSGNLATFVREEITEETLSPLTVPDPPPPNPGDPYLFPYGDNLIADPLFEVPILESPWFFQGGATLVNNPDFCTGSQTRCAYLQSPWSSVNSAWVNIPPPGMTPMMLRFLQRGGELLVKIHDGSKDSVWFVSDMTANPDQLVEVRMDVSADISSMDYENLTFVITYNSSATDFSEFVMVDEVRWHTGLGQQRKVVVNSPVPVFTDPGLTQPLLSKNTGQQYFLAGVGEEYPVINGLGVIAFYAEDPKDEWWVSSSVNGQAGAAALPCATPAMPNPQACVYLPLVLRGGGAPPPPPPPPIITITPATGWFATNSTKVEFKDYEIRTTLILPPGGTPEFWCSPESVYQLDPQWNGLGRSIEQLKAAGEEVTIKSGEWWASNPCPVAKVQLGERGPLSLLDGWICVIPAVPDITIRTDASFPSFWVLDINNQTGAPRFWQEFDIAAQRIEQEAAQRKQLIQGAVVVGAVVIVVAGGIVIIVLSPDHGVFTGPAYIGALSTSGALPRSAGDICVAVQEP